MLPQQRNIFKRTHSCASIVTARSASLYANSRQFQVAVQAAKVSGQPDIWKYNRDRLMIDCETTI